MRASLPPANRALRANHNLAIYPLGFVTALALAPHCKKAVERFLVYLLSGQPVCLFVVFALVSCSARHDQSLLQYVINHTTARANRLDEALT